MTVVAMAALLVIGTWIPITTGAEDSRRIGDLFAMRDGDVLLAFQDFTFGAEGWSHGQTSDRLSGIGPALGPFNDEAVRHSFELPVNADAVQLEFNVHMIGDWGNADTLTVSLGELGVVTLTASGATHDAHAPDASAMVAQDGIRVAVQRRVITPQRSETALPDTTRTFVSHIVRIAVTDPAESVVLRLVADIDGAGAWMLDNLTVVALSLDGGR